MGQQFDRNETVLVATRKKFTQNQGRIAAIPRLRNNRRQVSELTRLTVPRSF